MDELFTGGRAQNARPTKPVQVKPQKKPSKPLAEGEGSDVCVMPHVHEKENADAYAMKKEGGSETLLKNVERACNENRYLEGMVLGEILNTPKFKSRYGK